MTSATEPSERVPELRWAVLGTANIARHNFIPALQRAGGSVVAVGSRTLERARAFIAEAGLEATPCAYQEALDRDDVDAAYVALPNTIHLEWTQRALRAGKPVLCEKPLALTADDVTAAITTAEQLRRPLWEAFAFPFHRQWQRVVQLVQGGEIGELREVYSVFHFRVTQPSNIRWQSELGGGSLNDVGCYPVHLARLLFETEPARALAAMTPGGAGVDGECQGLLDFGSGRRLLFSSGMQRWRDTRTRLIGSDGEIELTDPYHPGPGDTLTLRRAGEVSVERLVPDEPSFAEMVRHIDKALAGETPALHLAASDSPGTARALAMIRGESRWWS